MCFVAQLIESLCHHLMGSGSNPRPVTDMYRPKIRIIVTVNILDKETIKKILIIYLIKKEFGFSHLTFQDLNKFGFL